MNEEPRGWAHPRNLALLVGCVIFANLAGGIGLLFGAGPGEWYRALVKPPGLPPSWVFGFVWPVLYTLMGVSLFLFWRHSRDRERRVGLYYFLTQWGLNALWTPLFFGFQLPRLALLDLTLLILVLSQLIRRFGRASTASAVLLVPYYVWLLYALYLNGGIVLLN